MEAIAGTAHERTERFNPFPGLRPFEPDEDHLFFGRERETDELLRRLRSNRFLSVLGTSGSGKSSLVRSGLIPSLYSGFMVKAGSDWRVAILRPGEDPIGNLALALDSPEVLGGDEQIGEASRMLLETSLRRSSLGLADCARHSQMAPQENLLVVVDQFEELFRFRESRREHGSRDEAVAFAKLLLGAANQDDVPVYVVVTMRSDFIGDCMEYPGLPEAINEGQYLIPRMTRKELRHAITGPVAVGGGEIEPRLVTRLLNEVGDDPDQLPVLQHSLMRSWDHWDATGADGAALDLGNYEGIGTMSQALSRHAEEAYGELDDAGKVIAERLFKSLTDKRKDERGVRRPTAVDEVATVAGVSTDDVIQVVDVFRKPGRSFLMPPTGVELGPESIIDLSHESLMRGWARLVEWVDDETQSGKEFRRLSRAARRYGRGQASLWVDPELSLGLKWRAESGSNAAWAKRYECAYEEALNFLDESKAANDARIEAAERERVAKLRRARILAVVLGSAAVITLIFGVLALRASVAAKVAQLQAVKEAETAEAVSNFLVDLFEVVDPEEAQGDTITAREILDQGAAKIDSQLAGQPEVQAQLMGTIGKVYGSLGLYDEAAPLLDRSLESSTALLGADAPATLTAMHRRAVVHRQQGHFREAQELFEAVLEGRRRVLGDEDAATLESQVALAEVANEQGRYQASAEAIRSAMEIQSRVLGAQHRDTLRSLSLLADAERDLGHYRESEELYRQAWEGQIAVLGEEHPETLTSMSELADLYRALGRYADAERLLVDNLEARRRVLGDEHPKTLTAESALAALDQVRGRWLEAEERMRVVLDARQRVLGEEHPSTLRATAALAWNLRLQSRPEDSEDLVVPALEIAERTLGEGHPTTIYVRNTLAASLNSQGRGPEAEVLYEKNLEISREKFGETHNNTLTARNNLAVAYRGRAEAVERLYQKNYDVAREAWGEEHPTTLFYLNNLTSTKVDQGRLDEAEPMAERSVELHRKVLGNDHPQTFTALNILRGVRVAQKRFEEADELVQEVLEGRRGVFGEDHPQTVNSYITMGYAHLQQGRFDEAQQLFQQVLEARTRLLGEEHPQTLWVYTPLSQVAGGKGEFDRILDYQTEALRIMRRVAFREGARLRQKSDYAQVLTWGVAPELQNPEEALQIMLDVNQATDYSDRNHRALLAECHFRAGDPETAIELLEETRPMVPADQIGFQNRIDSRIAKYRAAMGDDKQRRDAAMENLARVKQEAEAEGASPRSRNGYAWALVSSEFPDLRRPAEAIRVAEKVNADTGRERSHMLNTLAVAYLLDGQKQKALATLDEAIALIPDEDSSLESFRWRREAFELSDEKQEFDLLAVLPGKWLFVPPGAPIRVNIEWVHEGEYIQNYVLDDIPFLPSKDTALGRVHLGTRQFEFLENEDPSWTITRWKRRELRLTGSGDLLHWGEDWDVVRNTRP